MTTKTKQIAVLVDAENAQATLIEPILSRLKQEGDISLLKAYGDLTNSHLASWKLKAQKLGFETINEFASTSGKNITDISLCVDAIDLLHTASHINAFAFVTSDGDYAIAARKIKSRGRYMIGVGKSNTPSMFVNSCNLFIYSDHLKSDKSPQQLKQELIRLVNEAFTEGVNPETGHCLLSSLGHILHKIKPGFHVNDYGKETLAALINSLKPLYEVFPDYRNILYVKRNP